MGIVKFKSYNNNTTITNIVVGNLALKKDGVQKKEYETPKILKLVIGKKENKIFCGCWQVANQEDAC